jgi:hypothetical protein
LSKIINNSILYELEMLKILKYMVEKIKILEKFYPSLF